MLIPAIEQGIAQLGPAAAAAAKAPANEPTANGAAANGAAAGSLPASGVVPVRSGSISGRTPPPNILACALEASRSEGEQLDREDLLSQVKTFLFAGEGSGPRVRPHSPAC